MILLAEHCAAIAACRRCPRMIGPPVAPPPVTSSVYIVGQAPGPREATLGRPFAWTAGRTLFRWLAVAGADEERVRASVYFAAVARCFPGKSASRGGGDRLPDAEEIATCGDWMEREIALLRPQLVVPIGRLAMARLLPMAPLEELVGRIHRTQALGLDCDCIPLPHPSGVSTWYRRAPGAVLLDRALALLADHPVWLSTIGATDPA